MSGYLLKKCGGREDAPAINGYVPAVGWESIVFIGVFASFFAVMGSRMGAVNMVNTMMNTAYRLLQDTVFYIMAIAVLAGAISGLLTEFGVVALINRLLSSLMEPLYHLPGASILGVLATYLSDNPAILTLADDSGFRCFFKKYQLPALTNLGTSFGMGMIITTYMIGLQGPGGADFIKAALIGNLGAIVGSIVSVRLMLHFTKKRYGTEEYCHCDGDEVVDIRKYRKVREGNISARFMQAMLDGGNSGVQMGLTIIPGVLIICTMVLMLTNGAGASIGLILPMIRSGLAVGNDIAVFTAMCMCWSGYLSTHVAMMDSLHCSDMTGKAIFSHTIGGLVAGIAAHWIYVLIVL